ncbi:DUF4870 domain-containing protein [Metabacillus niabensis]|uniref:DUF4870 domain-containing protein n=1 Tax=Metabacillus niabensis TaxID=324854 RepID=UPI001CFADF66|nr:DUF4870 domain-containing protein [Metabacillus niabensis]
MDNTNKFLASLNYFSVFIAPLLLPIIIYFVVDHLEVKQHAKKALVSHIIPFLSIIGLFITIFFAAASSSSGDTAFFLIITGFVLVGLINLIVFIWNIVKGIKIFTKES